MIDPQPHVVALFTPPHEAGGIASFFYGVTQSFFLALPVSPPLLLCLRTALVQGFRPSFWCSIAAATAQTLFFGLIFSGSYGLMQVWYDAEPFLYIFGCILTFQLICSMFQETNKIPESLLIPSVFALMLCNPPQLFQVSRLTTTMEGGNAGYLVGIWIGMIFFSTLFCFILAPIFRTRKYSVNKVITILTASLIIATTSNYTWRVFLQYPADVMSDAAGANGIQRNFQSLDTNTRDRETNIQTRHREPVEQFLETYTFNEQPDIAEMQQMRTVLRYKTHFFNRFLAFWNEKRLAFRTPNSRVRTPEQVERLREVSLASSQRTSQQNSGKGKPTLSYVREHST
jgi:threonine/homoserine/homoserine lactone efflux protein